MRRTILILVGTSCLVLGTLVVVAQGLWPAPEQQRIEVAPDVVGVASGGSVAYVIQRGDRVALINSGGDPQATAILEELHKRGLGREDVDAVLLTHAFRDARAGARQFPNAKIYSGRADGRLLRGDRRPRAWLPQIYERLHPMKWRPKSVRGVLGGEVVEVGELEIEAVSTPGVTAGSMMYRYGDILFTGIGLLVQEERLALPSLALCSGRGTLERALPRLETVAFHRIADHVGGVVAATAKDVIAAL